MATVGHVTSGAGCTKFQATFFFFFKRAYNAAKSQQPTNYRYPTKRKVWKLSEVPSYDEASIPFWTQL